MKAWIIEPHCDDILFSCPELLEAGRFEDVYITTCHMDPERPNTMYQEIYGNHIHTISLGMQERIGSGHAGSFWNHRDAWARLVIATKIDLAKQWHLHQACRAWTDVTYIPMGIKHPHHVAVSEYFTEFCRPDKFTYYMDRPYYDVADHDLCDHAISKDAITTVETPDIDRHTLMLSYLEPKFHIGGIRNIKDSKYLSI